MGVYNVNFRGRDYVVVNGVDTIKSMMTGTAYYKWVGHSRYVNDNDVFMIEGVYKPNRLSCNYAFTLQSGKLIYTDEYQTSQTIVPSTPYSSYSAQISNISNNIFYHRYSGTEGSMLTNPSYSDENCLNLTEFTDLNEYEYFEGNVPTELFEYILGKPWEETDPYADVPANEPEGGDGDFDDTSDPIDFPTLPTISVSDAGFVSILNPSLAELKNLSDYLWSPIFDIDTVKKIYANPIDVILGLSILPVSIPANNTKRIKIGGLDTGIDMHVADAQFLDVDFGTLTIKSGTGNSYLDYEPYTKAAIFLPYIGWRDLSIDEIMNKTLTLKYRIDIVSGGCNAMLKCGDSVLYEFQGQCALQIPVTGVDYTSTISAAISAVGHIGSAVTGAVGGFGSALGGAALNNPVAGLSGIGQVGESVMNGLSGLASDVMSAKPQFPRSGSLGGTAGVLGHQQAYICLTRPRLARPKKQSSFVGYPAFITYTLSELEGTGFNSFESVKLEGIGLTAGEVSELSNILKGGVYL